MGLYQGSDDYARDYDARYGGGQGSGNPFYDARVSSPSFSPGVRNPDGTGWNADKTSYRLSSPQAQQAQKASQYADQFLSSWNASVAKAEGIFNAGMASIDELQPYIDSISAYGDDINALIQTAQTDLASYRTKYDPLETEAIETSTMALQEQRGYMEQLKGLATADYEGVSGIAKADVAAESERGRRAQARSLQSYGLDPTSGRYQGGMRSSRVNEALNKVLAANASRLAEKGRVAGVVATGLENIDPATMGGDIAKQIQTGAMDYSDMISGLTKTGADIQKTAVDAKTAGIQAGTDLATNYSRTITQPYGEAYMSMLGTGMASGPEYLSGINRTGDQARYPDGSPRP